MFIRSIPSGQGFVELEGAKLERKVVGDDTVPVE